MAKNEGTWFGFIGQQGVVKTLREHVEGSLRSNRPCPHVGLAGPSGSGKTELGGACLARAMGTNLLTFFATPASKRWQLARLVAQAKPHDILFVDEAHNIGSGSGGKAGGVAEVLYRVMEPENPQVPLVENDRIVENSWVSLPKITVVLASDSLGTLPKACLERLCLKLTLEPYPEDDLKTIASNFAARFNVLLSPQGAKEIARASRQSPRRVRHLVQSLATCVEDPSAQVSKMAVRRHLDMLGVTDNYLERNDLAYLGVLWRRRGYVALETISCQIGVDVRTLRIDVEPFLLRRELISVESRGRTLTAKGEVYVRERRLA